MIKTIHEDLINNWKTKTKDLSIKEELSLDKIIVEAIKRAHSPSVNRALNTCGNSTRNPRENAANYLQTQIYELVNDSTIDERKFDLWIKEACYKIRQFYHDENIKDYTLGNAQKLVNMTIKFLFSAKSIDYNLQLFKVCHLPIDRVIMKKAKKHLNINKLKNAWSKTDDWDDIIDYQNQIREKVSLEEEKYPLFWECNHWNKE